MKNLVTTTILVATLTACGGQERAEDPGASASDVPADARPAVDDLVAELDVDLAAVESVAVEEVTWNDGSLGCASDGDMYTQATVEGQRITMTVDGQDYEYHQGGDRAPFLCEDPTE
ncbi:hypothetical protein GCM10009623_38500 [Nocardioides aestuarii]|uniref:DUF4333 domain-containing protein n=1 Tax=Nocardioides aestuarii TaxID=252231 RepID=A0ABW4TTE0_9ACTN